MIIPSLISGYDAAFLREAHKKTKHSNNDDHGDGGGGGDTANKETCFMACCTPLTMIFLFSPSLLWLIAQEKHN